MTFPLPLPEPPLPDFLQRVLQSSTHLGATEAKNLSELPKLLATVTDPEVLNHALRLAVLKQNLAVVTHLLDHSGVDPRADRSAALNEAALTEVSGAGIPQAHAITALLYGRSEPAVVSADLVTAIHWAALDTLLIHAVAHRDPLAIAWTQKEGESLMGTRQALMAQAAQDRAARALDVPPEKVPATRTRLRP